MPKRVRLSLLTAVLLCLSSNAGAQTTPAPTKLKDKMRMPWQRGDRNFLRLWPVAGPFPGGSETDCLSGQGGEAGIQATDGLEQVRADGTSVKWHSQKSWGGIVGFDDLTGPKDGAVAYAFTKVSRSKAGKAVLLVGSEDGIRVWLNGKPVLTKDGLRSLTPDEDQVEVDMNAGENVLLVKVAAPKSFSARVRRSYDRFAFKSRFVRCVHQIRRAGDGRRHVRDHPRPGRSNRGKYPEPRSRSHLHCALIETVEDV